MGELRRPDWRPRPTCDEVRAVCQHCADRGRQRLLALAQRDGRQPWLLFVVDKSDSYQVVAAHIVDSRALERMRATGLRSDADLDDRPYDEALAELTARRAPRIDAVREHLARGATPRESPRLKEAFDEVRRIGRTRFRPVTGRTGLLVLPCRRCTAVPRVSVERLLVEVEAAWRTPTRTVYL